MAHVAFTAPHYAAAEIAQKFLFQGASAVDAMISASAAISVLYPHMNSLAGDGFWLIQYPGEAPLAIDACGTAASMADIDWYKHKDCPEIPSRGGLAAVCMGGTLDGWRVARSISEAHGQKLRPLDELLSPAILFANEGVGVTHSLQTASEKVQPDLKDFADYQSVFCPGGRTLKKGDLIKNPGLGKFLGTIATDGVDSFFNGILAENLTDWLEYCGSPLRKTDFSSYRASQVKPLSVKISDATLFNLPAPTQGIASLLILAIYDILNERRPAQTEAEQIHYLVEATKQAFLIRDRELTDPSRLSPAWDSLLEPESIADLVDQVNTEQAMPWPKVSEPGDTVWMGCLDDSGCMVSFIQSVYWEFGSGLVHPDYGLVWNNRGMSFSLDREHPNSLAPNMKPFHTLNPAMAIFDDGRRLSYGTMGGEGQPQTQAAVFSRYARQGYNLGSAIARGRWLLGRTWGDQSQDLKLEEDLYSEVGADLIARGHQISQVPEKTELMGHAGAVLLNPDGSVTAATDPRSDGRAHVSE